MRDLFDEYFDFIFELVLMMILIDVISLIKNIV